MAQPLATTDKNSETNILNNFLLQSTDDKGDVKSHKVELPKISVVMPSFNQAQFIERSIISVLNQGYPNLEFIIIDGGSTDDTVEVIKKYETSLAYWHSGPDKGQSDALNHGFSKANGDIFCWLNSDDLFLPETFKCIAREFSANQSKTVIFGDWWDIDGDDNVVFEFYAFDFSLGQFMYEGFHLNTQAMFWRREAHKRFGKFDVSLHRTMDYDLIVRLGLNEGQKNFKRISQAFAGFRRHDEQKTRLHEENESLGFDPVVRDEHRHIARKNNFDNKYSWSGKLFRFGYRFRRAYWYAKRGGIAYAYARIMKR